MPKSKHNHPNARYHRAYCILPAAWLRALKEDLEHWGLTLNQYLTAGLLRMRDLPPVEQVEAAIRIHPYGTGGLQPFGQRIETREYPPLYLPLMTNSKRMVRVLPGTKLLARLPDEVPFRCLPILPHQGDTLTVSSCGQTLRVSLRFLRVVREPKDGTLQPEPPPIEEPKAEQP
jgi:hypothetical protein